MAANANLVQQLQQELQNELTTSNQLLWLISLELSNIKQLTNPGGEFESNIKLNTSLLARLANMQKIDIENIPPMNRVHLDLSNNSHRSISNEQNETLRDISNMDETK